MKSPDSSTPLGRWTSLWVVASLSLFAQLWLCQFFSFGELVPISLDVNPSNLWKLGYQFPPTGSFQVLNWLGLAYLPQPMNPLSIAATLLSPWFFFTAYVPVIATLALLAMVAFLRELDLPRPAALFGGLVYAWQGDVLPFIYPGHYAYLTTWPFFALGAWGVLRGERTGQWAYAVISGACCGLMVGLQPDRGAIASLLIAGLYFATIFRRSGSYRSALDYLLALRPLALCVAIAAMIALAPLLALFKSNIEGVKIAGSANREETYKLVTQYCLAPVETFTYLVPGFFGWHMNNHDGPYWGWIGEWPDWPKNHQGMRNLNLAISTTGTIATVLALIGLTVLLSKSLLGSNRLTDRQQFYARVLLAFGFITLILSWGWHTGFYRPLFALPLMDKWRNPLKWLEMTNFALVVLSAIGVQHLLASLDAEPASQIRRRVALSILCLSLLLGLAWILSYPGALVLRAMLLAEGCDPDSVVRMMATMHTSLLWSVLLMALFYLVLRGLSAPEKLRAWPLPNPWLDRLWKNALLPEHIPLTLTLTLAALTTVQLGWVATQFIQPVPIHDLTATNPLLEALRSEGNTVRVSVPTDDPLLKDDLLQNQFAAMNISSLDISAASRIPDDLNAFDDALDSNQPRLWFLAGVKNVAIPESGLDQMRQDPGISANIDHANGYTLEPTASPDLPSHALVGMKDYLAKATLVPSFESFPTDKALLARLKDPKWSPRQTVLLDHASPILPPSVVTTRVSDDVDLETYTPTEIEIKVSSSNGGFLLINDQYDPDWQVQVDGRAVPLLRADYILRAVQVPTGNSTVTMRYVAHYHLAGLSLPAVAVNNFSDVTMLAAWLIAGFALRRRKPQVNS
jgi:hypothetical protein